MKFTTTPVWHYPNHLRHVATLPWEMKNSNFLQIFSRCGRKCKQIAFLITSNFANHSQYWLHVKFFNSLLFHLYTFVINLWHRKFIPADITAMFVNNQHGIQWWGQDFDKYFICNQYGERLAVLHTENIKICGWITMLEAIKMQCVCISAEYLHKIWIFNFQGSVATCPKVSWILS